ncbi:MAG: ribonuclease HII [Oscillospiraceae bacterium]|nr:ribonuclease HII [Oscillospiraceae bacterium]
MNWHTEDGYISQGYATICGVDEAGRGPLAGDVYAAACILPYGLELVGLDDSKKLTAKRREGLFDQICHSAVAYCIASATVAEIEEHNILGAAMLAMTRAVEGLATAPSIALIDGNRTPKLAIPAVAIVKGDGVSPNIAAASILAKVARDRACLEMDKSYPQYNFAKHKGYGTREHMDLVRLHGPCPLHRPSFLKFLRSDAG